MWMLDYRARLPNCRWSEMQYSIITRWMLKWFLNTHTLKEVNSYTDRFDIEVYHELKRMQNVIYWSLDDYFVYNFKEKSLKQILCEDLGLHANH
jgi:hypothetical protein